ncbi:MAG: hypothetical protein QGH60_00240 [Phycisphaerae bacterium]|jgi:hypothetical protein|nr:hypothetical protein [Phycisphaerae bacterium]
MKKSVILSAAAILCLTACASGEETGEIKLAPPYIDPVRGFSLRPPVDTVRSRATSANRLVVWTRRKSPKAPILWQLSVYGRTDETFKPGGNLLAWGKGLAKQLAKIEGFKAPAPRVIELGGTKTVNLRGLTAGKVQFWQRRVWVHLRAAKFLEVRISGPVAAREKLDAIATAVLKTLKITDPKNAQVRRKGALTRGAELLKAFTDKKLTAALDTKEQWFLYRRGEKVIGFMLQKEAGSKSGGKSGCRVKSWIMLKFDGRALKLRREMFTTADRSAETWLETGRVESAGKSVVMEEKGTKSDSRIDCRITVGPKTIKNKPAGAPKDNYLPRAMAWLLRRMVDLKEPAPYAFATYNGRSGRFNLRTFTVIGPDEIEAGGRKVRAIRVTDQLTSETQAADMWVDLDGKLLIMNTADGLIMEIASDKAVHRRFPNARETVKAMGQ